MPPQYNKFQTVDAIYKLGSYPVPMEGRSIATMDKIMAQELQGAVISKAASMNTSHNKYLGFLLDIAEIYPHGDKIPLYNMDTWNWPLPRDMTAPTDRKSKGGSWQELHIAAFFNAVALATKLVIMTQAKTSVAEQYWLGLYSTCHMPGTIEGAGTYHHKLDMILIEKSETSDCPSNSISWTNLKVIAEYTSQVWKSATHLLKTLHTKAYLIFLDQPWRWFMLGLSIAKWEMHVHFYNHSGSSISPPFNIYHNPNAVVAILVAVMFSLMMEDSIPKELEDIVDHIAHPEPAGKLTQTISIPNHEVMTQAGGLPTSILLAGVDVNVPPINPALSPLAIFNNPGGPIGEIWVCDIVYEVMEILFSSGGFLGQDGQMYIIKDYWVENPLQEQKMMKLVEGIPGRNWLPASGTFLSLKSNSVLEKTVQKGILHCDISPFNILFEDTPDGVHSILIDWEFTVEMTYQVEYDVSGTGTIPFLSINLLAQISAALQWKSRGKSQGTHTYNQDGVTSVQLGGNDFTVQHEPADNIESLFYVFIWTLVLYDGPSGWRQQDFDFESSILDEWSEGAIQNPQNAQNSKFAFIVDDAHYPLQKCVSPYFYSLIPLADDWRKFFWEGITDRKAVNINSLLKVTESFLSKMLLEDPPGIMNEHLTKQAEKDALHKPLPSTPVKHTAGQGSGKKCLCNDTIQSAAAVLFAYLKTLFLCLPSDQVAHFMPSHSLPKKASRGPKCHGEDTRDAASQKKHKAGTTVQPTDSTSEPTECCHSSRAGAGTSGHILQLERAGAVIEG
ncbi:hypothetical protein EDC04DRAFT_2610201 [Pisolithus marmoratus]|nr:hypothetical protein EDC04DRAFT_2610201 [Pisolithus marmoratus]